MEEKGSRAVTLRSKQGKRTAQERASENDKTGMSKTARGDSEIDNDKEDSPFSTPKMSATPIDEPIVPDLKLPTRPGFTPPSDFPPLPV